MHAFLGSVVFLTISSRLCDVLMLNAVVHFTRHSALVLMFIMAGVSSGADFISCLDASEPLWKTFLLSLCGFLLLTFCNASLLEHCSAAVTAQCCHSAGYRADESTCFGIFAMSSFALLWVFLCVLIFQVSEAGVHRPHVSGIAGRSEEGAFSLVLAGGYEDDKVHDCTVLLYCTVLVIDFTVHLRPRLGFQHP